MHRRNYEGARVHLRRAARHEPLREEATCMLAEAALLSGKAGEALAGLNGLLAEAEGMHWKRSPRVRLLRGVAGCMLGRPAAARRELAGIPRAKASADELLAAVQACVLCGDEAGARQLLEALGGHELDAPMAARAKLCEAALEYRAGNWRKALAALPEVADCAPADGIACGEVRGRLVEMVSAVESVGRG